MLDELGPWLCRSKARDLINRIDHNDPDQAIPAEYELAIGWSLSKIGNFNVEPVFGSKTPDFLSGSLFPEKPTVIEVMALSDDALSGESSMERTANIINQFANRVRKKSSSSLHYSFLDESGYHPVKLSSPIGPWTHRSQYFRRRLTSPKFALTAEHEVQIRQWLSVWPPMHPLRIDGEGTAVVISWKEWVHPKTKTFSSMPSEAHDLKHNPLYERLKEKEKQLAFVPPDHLKCIFLGDAGCRLLRNPTDHDGTNRKVSGKDIVLKFLNDSDVDIVCILTPKRKTQNSISNHSNPRKWHAYVFDKRILEENYYDKVFDLAENWCNPHLDGYQARSWMQQGMLAPQARGQYLGTTILSGGERLTAKISARALMELLAGRLSDKQFKDWIAGAGGDKDKNLFELWLSQGRSISAVTFESMGPDRDDDYVIFEFERDPNASKLRLPDKLLDSDKG